MRWCTRPPPFTVHPTSVPEQARTCIFCLCGRTRAIPRRRHPFFFHSFILFSFLAGAFKTHSAPPLPGGPPFLPYREDLKYIVVFRNPEEAMVSFLPFLKGHRQEMWDYFNAGMVKAAFVGPDDITFKDWFYEKALPFSPAPGVPAPPGGLLDVFFNSFIEGWWPYRHKSNVLMLHFNDMKADHEGKVLSRRPFGFISILEDPNGVQRTLLQRVP